MSESAPEIAPVSLVTATDKKPRRAGSSELRQQVALTLRITSAPAPVRRLLAIAVDENSGASSIEDIAVAANVRRVLARQLLQSLDDIVQADPMEAGIMATMMIGDKEALRSIWKLLNDLGVGGSARDVGGPAKSGLALAIAAQSLTPESRKLIQNVLRVLGDK